MSTVVLFVTLAAGGAMFRVASVVVSIRSEGQSRLDCCRLLAVGCEPLLGGITYP